MPAAAITAMKVAGTSHNASAAELGCEYADRQHGDDVIEPGKRMRKSMHQIVCLPDARMRQHDRWRRHCNRRGGQKSQCLAIHGETPIPARYDRYRIRYQGGIFQFGQ